MVENKKAEGVNKMELTQEEMIKLLIFTAACSPNGVKHVFKNSIILKPWPNISAAYYGRCARRTG